MGWVTTWSRRLGRELFGFSVALTVLAALPLVGKSTSWPVWLGVVAVFVSGLSIPFEQDRAWVMSASYLLGVSLVANFGVPKGHGGVVWFIFIAALVVVPLILRFSTLYSSKISLTLPALLISACGIYLTIPDTEQARILVAVLVAANLLMLVSNGLVLTHSGVRSITMLMIWVIAAGGWSRTAPSS